MKIDFLNRKILMQIHIGNGYLNKISKKLIKSNSTINRRLNYLINEGCIIQSDVKSKHSQIIKFQLTEKGENILNTDPKEIIKSIEKGGLISPYELDQLHPDYNTNSLRGVLRKLEGKEFRGSDGKIHKIIEPEPGTFYMDDIDEDYPIRVKTLPHPLEPINLLLWALSFAPPWCSLLPVPQAIALRQSPDCINCPVKTTCPISPSYSI